MKYNEKDFWASLANGDNVYCRTDAEVEKAAESLAFLYDLTERRFSYVKEAAPCYLFAEKGKHIFSKTARDGEVVEMSDFSLHSF